MSANSELRGPFPPCRHCGKNPTAAHKRGLCRTCYQKPEVVAQYERLHTAEYTHDADDNATVGRLPAQPTQAIPGSLEKLLVIEQRVARHERVDHPHDLVMSNHRDLPDMLFQARDAQPSD